MNELFFVVFSLTITGSILIALLCIMKPLIVNRITKKFQYYIWLIVVLRLLIPFSININLLNEAFHTIINQIEVINDSIMIGNTIDNRITSNTTDSTSSIDYNESNISNINQTDSLVTDNNKNPINIIDKMLQVYQVNILLRYIWIIWLCGVLFMLSRILFQYYRFMKVITKKRITVTSTVLNTVFIECCKELRVRKQPSIYMVPFINTPMFAGFFKPMILLPDRDYGTNELRYILLHELNHYRKGDIFYKWLVQITVCIHWFNPFVYLMANQIKHACELACDEAVIKNLNNEDKKEYGLTLINLSTNLNAARASLAMGENKKNLKNRLTAIIKYRKNLKRFKIIAFFITFIMISTALLINIWDPDLAVAKVSEQLNTLNRVDPESQADLTEINQIKGTWKGASSIDDTSVVDFIVNIYIESGVQNVLLSSDALNVHYLPLNWEIRDNQLNIMFDNNDTKEEIGFRLVDENTLSGTYSQAGKSYELTLMKTSEDAVNGTYYKDTRDMTYEERLQQLKFYSEYEDDNSEIPFTYELNLRDKYRELIETYDLDTVTKGCDDVELMIKLMNWVCDNFQHDGMSLMPDERNAYSIIDYCNENSGAINARGLSILLAELLRLYGIPAKHITCLPKESDFTSCHVVVHAYSEKLGQWIMLDPEFRVILQDKNGNYINLPILREILIHNDDFYANDNAGRNGSAFDIGEYREYMVQNMFRFECGTDYDFGSEDGRSGNTANMLIPLNYKEYSKVRTTTSEEAFWALP